jgi:hypothetical protein
MVVRVVTPSLKDFHCHRCKFEVESLNSKAFYVLFNLHKSARTKT